MSDSDSGDPAATTFPISALQILELVSRGKQKTVLECVMQLSGLFALAYQYGTPSYAQNPNEKLKEDFQKRVDQGTLFNDAFILKTRINSKCPLSAALRGEMGLACIKSGQPLSGVIRKRIGDLLPELHGILVEIASKESTPVCETNRSTTTDSSPQPSGVWIGPLTTSQWSKVFGCGWSRNKTSRWLNAQKGVLSKKIVDGRDWYVDEAALISQEQVKAARNVQTSNLAPKTANRPIKKAG